MDHLAPATAPDDVAALRTSLRGHLLDPGDDDYNAARVVWNGMIDRRPAFIACCAGVADVIQSVAFARRHALPLSIRGGGHNVAGYAVCEGGLMIDLSAMRAVRVDPGARRAWVQGGALWGDVDCETTAFGLATPGGLISQTGVAGLTLSGGFGWLRGTHGLCVDNLEAVDIVTADGRFLHADADEYADLFWAVRGGGGNLPFMLSLDAIWSSPHDDAVNIDWVRATWADMQRCGTGRMYLNFPGHGESDELVRSALGPEIYTKLAQVKRAYDPSNLFRMNQNVLPA